VRFQTIVALCYWRKMCGSHYEHGAIRRRRADDVREREELQARHHGRSMKRTVFPSPREVGPIEMAATMPSWPPRNGSGCKKCSAFRSTGFHQKIPKKVSRERTEIDVLVTSFRWPAPSAPMLFSALLEVVAWQSRPSSRTALSRISKASPRNLWPVGVGRALPAAFMLKTIPDRSRERLRSAIALQRFGQRRGVAEAIVFLLSSAASHFIRGQVLRTNGGPHMRAALTLGNGGRNEKRARRSIRRA